MARPREQDGSSTGGPPPKFGGSVCVGCSRSALPTKYCASVRSAGIAAEEARRTRSTYATSPFVPGPDCPQRCARSSIPPSVISLSSTCGMGMVDCTCEVMLGLDHGRGVIQVEAFGRCSLARREHNSLSSITIFRRDAASGV